MDTWPFTANEIDQLTLAITDMAILWDVPMSPKRLEQYLMVLSQQRAMPFSKIMRSINLARVQDRVFPMPADILQRDLRG